MRACPSWPVFQKKSTGEYFGPRNMWVKYISEAFVFKTDDRFKKFESNFEKDIEKFIETTEELKALREIDDLLICWTSNCHP